MTAADEKVTLDGLAERLDGLTDLFKRRLLDDRAKQSAIEDLQARLTRAEKAASALALQPLVEGLSLVLERLQQGVPSADFVASIGNELEYVLEAVVGVTVISATPGDAVDRRRHEVTSASGEGAELFVDELVRVGYEKDDVVLRPAKVIAIRDAPDSELDPGADE